MRQFFLKTAFLYYIWPLLKKYLYLSKFKLDRAAVNCLHISVTCAALV
jgi:hypothetical protein